VIFFGRKIIRKYLFSLGSKIRFHKKYSPEGKNVNFVEVEKDNQLFVRTYERGVEESTLSCGTGSLSNAIVYSLDKGKESLFNVRTEGGDLEVDFIRDKNKFKNIVLIGKVEMITRGELLPQPYND
jgi:diaminopimelate epimerase